MMTNDEIVEETNRAVSRLLSAGLDRLPSTARTAVLERIAAGATLRCEIDIDRMGGFVARGLVVGDATTTELFTLKTPDVERSD